MAFEQGHSKSQGKRKPGGGRKKGLSTLVKEAKDNDARNLPKYFDKLSELALSGDREALFYLISWQIGKPKTNIELEGGEKLGLGMITQVLDLIASNRRDTYELATPKVIIEGVKDGQERASETKEAETARQRTAR